MSKTRICKIFEFGAAHYLRNEELSLEENKNLFGKCSDIRFSFNSETHHIEEKYCEYPHGHTYKIEVLIEGIPDSRTGMLINFSELKRLVQEHIIKEYDHKFLNKEVVPYSRGCIPTAENMADQIFRILSYYVSEYYENCKLISIKVWEGPESWAEVICGE